MQQQEQHIDSKANNTQDRQRKPRRGLRATHIVLASLLALIVVIVAAVIIWLGPIAERVVERYDKELIGRRIEMSNLRIKLFRGELSVDSLRMFEPNDSTHFVNIDHLESSIAVCEAFKRHIDITGISLSRPSASVVMASSMSTI